MFIPLVINLNYTKISQEKVDLGELVKIFET